MAFKFQLGQARMSGSLIQEGDFALWDDDGTVRVSMARDNGSITGSAMSLSDGDLTNVGAIKCDVIEPDAAGTGLSLVFGGDTTKNMMSLTDNLADALNIEEGGASYLKFTTTNGSELITFGKNSTFASTTIANLGTVTTADIDGGTIDGCTIATSDVTVGAGKTLNVSAGTLTTSAAQKLAIVEGVGANTDIGAYSFTAQTLVADVADGTAPLTITSTTKVSNLNVDKLDGADWAAPAAIGSTTPAAGTFTNLIANGNVDLGDAVTDTITATGRFDSDLTPSTDSQRNLGSDSLRWSTIYVDSIVGADVNFDVESLAVGNTISAGTDYALVTNGDGTVTLPTAVAGKRLYVKLGNARANVTIAAGGSDALPEVTGSLVLESTGSAITLVAIDATNWYIQ